ncbi:MAG: serine/threonine-protein kinase [Cyanobacteriota bacterium]|nr:serine/threonine-protein kinase [Cyanobacteriota bacterium]
MSERKVGEMIGDRYRLTQLIGAGGMGQIFKAVDTRLFQRPVAIKLLSQPLSDSPKLRLQLEKRFEEEARVSVLLGEHPRIIQVIDYGFDQHQPYLIMEYLGFPPTAFDLGYLIDQQGPLDPQRVVRLAQQICSGLHHAHRFETILEGRAIRGVIHRDIKPSNIFVLGDSTLGETIKILDFGIAKVVSDATINMGTQSGFIGTPGYASPEQLRGEDLDARSDIYSLGVVIYQMLTGKLPLSPKTPSFPAWYEAHNYLPPRSFREVMQPCLLPASLEQVVMSCLAKDRQLRPSSMQALSQHLGMVLQDVSGSQIYRANLSTLTTPNRSSNELETQATNNPPPLTTGPKLHLTQQHQTQLENLLIKSIGPIAPVLLQQSLQEAPSPEYLIDELAANLPPHQQPMFRQQATSLFNQAQHPPTTPPPSQPQTANYRSAPTQPKPPTQPKAPSHPSSPGVDEVFLQRCEREMVDLVGPMGSFVLKQVMARGNTLSRLQLIQALTQEIPHPQKAQELQRRLSS